MAHPKNPGIISQEQYDKYAANWLKIVNKSEGTELQESFRVAHGALVLMAVTFPVLQIVRLVSTVGARHIKARFLVKHDEPTGAPHFTLALFATDAQGARVSSYYLAEEYWNAPAELSTVPQGKVPDVLAHYWLQKWAAVSEVSPQLFASSYGPLRGYTFPVDDFMLPLQQLAKLGDEKLRVDFGLHEYYRPSPDGDGDTLAHTFGLVLQLQGLAAQGGDAPQAAADTFYDMATPSPPAP